MKTSTLTICGVGLLLLAGPAGAAEIMPTPPSLAPMALNSMSRTPDRIATAMVMDDNNLAVGTVRNVETDAVGKPSKVNVSLLGSEQIIALDSADVSYDQSRNVLVAALDKNQIARMPHALQPQD